MGTAKRERQKQGRQARIEAALAAQQRAQRKKTVRNFALVVVVIVAVLFGLSQFTGKSNTTTSTSSGDTASGAATSTTAAGTPVAITIPPAGATLTDATPCPATDGSSPRTTTFAQAPPVCIDPAKSYSAKVDTSMGSFTIALDATKAPIATNNFVVLSRYHYYDGTAFHRIIPGFVVQGGDAVGPTPGQGGPGYKFADELPTGAAPYYPLQSVAMANSGANTNGSQFFVVTGDQGVSLPAQYTNFGMVTDGFDVVKSIEAVGTTGGHPQPDRDDHHGDDHRVVTSRRIAAAALLVGLLVACSGGSPSTSARRGSRRVLRQRPGRRGTGDHVHVAYAVSVCGEEQSAAAHAAGRRARHPHPWRRAHPRAPVRIELCGPQGHDERVPRRRRRRSPTRR